MPVEDLSRLASFELLQQMEAIDQPDDPTLFPNGRSVYIEAVRDEVISRHPDWSSDAVRAIREHRVDVGMTPSQVVASIGWPNEYPAMLWAFAPGTDPGPSWNDDFEVHVQRADVKRWSYGRAPNNLHVWFDQGVVWNIIDNGRSARWFNGF